MKLTPRDAGRVIGVGPSRMAQLDREGILPAERDSAGRRIYDPEVVEAFAAQRKAQARLREKRRATRQSASAIAEASKSCRAVNSCGETSGTAPEVGTLRAVPEVPGHQARPWNNPAAS